MDAASRFVETLNPIGQRCAIADCNSRYHNHDFEFAPLPGGDGATLWDLIMAGRMPTSSNSNSTATGQPMAEPTPSALLKSAPERYPLLHFKDMHGAGKDRHDSPIGTGHMEFGPILRARRPRPRGTSSNRISRKTPRRRQSQPHRNERAHPIVGEPLAAPFVRLRYPFAR